MLRGVQCSCMSLMSVFLRLFIPVSIWDSFDLDCILQEGDLLFKSLNKLRYLGMEDLPDEFFIDNWSINVEFLNNRTGLIRFTLGKPVVFVIWPHSKDEIGIMSAVGTAVLLKFVLLQSLENFIKPIYYSNYPMSLYSKYIF